MNKETFQRRVKALAKADGWNVEFSHNEVQNHATMKMNESSLKFIFFNNVHGDAVYHYIENGDTGSVTETSRAFGLEIEPDEHWNKKIREAAE